MQQFFTDNFILSPDQVRQCKKVLRMRAGDEIRVVDQNGQGKIMSFVNDDLNELKFIQDIIWPEVSGPITIVMSLIRSERLEWFIQKATELGVHKIVLYVSDHGVVRSFGDRETRKIQRIQEIAKEASEQSYRQDMPEIVGLVQKKDIKDYLSETNFICDVGNHPFLISENKPGSTTLWIGPEGGFSESERHLAAELEMKFVSLGHHVLRAESAGMMAVSMAQIQGEFL